MSVGTFLALEALMLLASIGLGIYILTAGRAHRHTYEPWGDWIEDSGYKYTKAIRYRTCNQCNRVDRQKAGGHDCIDSANNRKCSHLDRLLNPEARIARLERDLGIPREGDKR